MTITENRTDILTIMAAKRADDIQTNLGRPLTHDEWDGLVERLVQGAIQDSPLLREKGAVDIGGLWIQPQVREQSRLPFNIDYNEDLDEWTEERVELSELLGQMPDEGRFA